MLTRIKHTFLHFAEDIVTTDVPYKKKRQQLILKFSGLNIGSEVAEFVPYLLDTFKTRVKLHFSTSHQLGNVYLAQMLQLPAQSVISQRFVARKKK